MIDINLLGKRPAPEKTAAVEPPNRTRLIALGGAAVVLVVAYFLYGDSLFQSTPEVFTADQQAKLDSLNRILTQRRTMQPDTQQVARSVPPAEPEAPPSVNPPVEPKPAPAPWDYRLSAERLHAYVALVQTLPSYAQYTVVSVSSSGIIAEVNVQDESNVLDVQDAIVRALPGYTFDFTPRGSFLQVWGSLTSVENLSEYSLSGDVTTPEANLKALNELTRQYGITIQRRGKTTNASEGGVNFLPVWIKYRGTEDNILGFLTAVREKGLSLFVTKVSGQNLNRGQSNAASVLNFQFEVVL